MVINCKLCNCKSFRKIFNTNGYCKKCGYYIEYFSNGNKHWHPNYLNYEGYMSDSEFSSFIKMKAFW